MVLPMLDDEPMLDEITERNIRECERLDLLTRLKSCLSMQDVERFIEELEQSVDMKF